MVFELQDKSMLYLFILLSALQGHAYFEHSENSPAEMNGIKFSDHKDFSTKWKLVTVRYREDSKELRLTYANDIAFKAMSSLKPDYPDGAKFGKVAFLTEEDPAFPSSRIPTSTRRFQLMVKNRKLYSTTNNWGYALFDEKGVLFKEDIKEKTEACAACHQLVPERDYVFSRPFHNSQTTLAPMGKRSEGISFKAKKPADFKGPILEHLKASTEWIESLEGPLQKYSFSGTLDEVIPLLLERVKLMGKDSVLYVNERNFSLVKIRTGKNDCLGERSKPVSILIYFNGGKVREAEHCI